MIIPEHLFTNESTDYIGYTTWLTNNLQQYIKVLAH